jgi:hypothetical protein
MLSNFKKLGVAAAVASTLGVSGAAHAVLQGVPGDALLIPHVIASNLGGTVTNTLIGVTVGSVEGTNTDQFVDLSQVDATHPVGVGTLSPGKTDAAGCARSGAAIHWYFFDVNSVEVVNDTIPVTCEDFVRIDWNFIIANKSLPSALNRPGYMVITDAAAGDTTQSNMVLYASVYLIRGNWASQAYIPVLPLVDSVDGTRGDEIDHAGAFLANVNPVTSGMLLPSPGTNSSSVFSLRYFLDPALRGSTTFVLWFPENNDARDDENVLVYDADEGNISAVTSIPNELNVCDVSRTATVTPPYNCVITDGLEHINVDGAGDSAVGPAVNTGFVLFAINDFNSDSSLTPVEGSRAGFAFSLIGIGGGAVADQVQTELAHERGLLGAQIPE